MVNEVGKILKREGSQGEYELFSFFTLTAFLIMQAEKEKK